MRIDQVIFEVTRAGGLCRTTTLGDRGFSRREIAGAVACGRLQRPVRGWVSVPNADPVLTSAVTAGVVLSCLPRDGSVCGCTMPPRRTCT